MLPISKCCLSQNFQLSTFAIVGFQFGLYHVVVPLNFLRGISLASLFAIISSLLQYSIIAFIATTVRFECVGRYQGNFFLSEACSIAVPFGVTAECDRGNIAIMQKLL